MDGVDELSDFMTWFTTQHNQAMMDRFVDANERAQPLRHAVAARYGIALTVNVGMVSSGDNTYITPDFTASPIQWILVEQE